MRSRIAVWLLCLLLPSLAAALDPSKAMTQYASDVWRIEEGLPHTSVTSVAQTSDGFLWVGTEEGLARFDGLRFMVFDTVNTPELRNGHVLSLLTDRNGALWISTYGGGVVRYDHGVFTSFSGGLSNLVVGALYEDREGRIWAATDAGPNVLEGGRFHRYATPEPLGSDIVLRVLEDARGDLWIGTYGGGLTRIHAGTSTRYTTANGLPSNIIKALFQDKSGALWIGSEAGLARYADGKFQTFTQKDGLPNDLIKDIRQDRNGSLWIATDAGVVRYAGGKFASLGSKDGLVGDAVKSIFEDRDGSIWLAVVGAGLERLRDGKFLTYTAQEGLSYDHVRVILEDRDGFVWIGTRGGGLDRFRGGKFEHFGAAQGIDSDSIFALEQAADGAIWAGTRHGLFVYRGARFQPVALDGLVHDSAIWAIHQDWQGDLWIGTGGGGLVRIHDGKQQRFTTAEGLVNNAVPLVFEDRKHQIWIGTDGGMNIYRGGELVSFKELGGVVPIAIFEDPDGTLWVGTHGDGLRRLKAGRITAYTGRDGLFDDVIFTIEADQRGNLWFSSQRGIFRVARAQLEKFATGQRAQLGGIHYGKDDGLKTTECIGGTQPAMLHARDGRFWYATRRGVAIVDPNHIPAEPPPAAFLEAIAINQRSWPVGADAVVPPGNGELAFHYTALDLNDAKGVTFRYKLEGFNEDWIEAGTRRDAFYTNIPPGDYKFLVMAANGEGMWSEAPARFTVRLRPHLYQTRVFYAGVILLGLLIAFGVYQLRVAQLKARQRELKQKVEEAMANLRTLSGLLPICAGCKKIRDDKGYWEHIETYIRSHSQADFSHGMCPDCIQRLYPEEWARIQADKVRAKTAAKE